MDSYNPNIKPGVLEVFCGPMKSGKSLALLHRVEKLKYMEGCRYLFIKPILDTRDAVVKSRFGTLSHDCLFVDEKNPRDIFLHVLPEHQLIAIDEAHFFGEDFPAVIEELVRLRKNVIVSGLDSDFRGEPFGSMPRLLVLADEVHKLAGICDFPGCSSPATRTQRLVNGFPASYSDPVVLVGDAKEGYQCRCLAHHEVVNKPLLNSQKVAESSKNSLS